MLRSLDEIKGCIWNRNLSQIQAETGISYTTVFEIARGKRKNISYSTLVKLNDWIEKNS